jgi:hypothetical protein
MTSKFMKPYATWLVTSQLVAGSALIPSEVLVVMEEEEIGEEALVLEVMEEMGEMVVMETNLYKNLAYEIEFWRFSTGIRSARSEKKPSSTWLTLPELQPRKLRN